MKFQIFNENYAVLTDAPSKSQRFRQLIMIVISLTIGIPCMVVGVFFFLLSSGLFDYLFSLLPFAFGTFFIFIGILVGTGAIRKIVIIDRDSGTLAYGFRLLHKFNYVRWVWRLETVKPDDFRQQKALRANSYSLMFIHNPYQHEVVKSPSRGTHIARKRRADLSLNPNSSQISENITMIVICREIFDLERTVNRIKQFISGEHTTPGTWYN